MKTKELQQSISEKMKQWQSIEDRAVSATSQVMEKSTHPLLRLVMEIIQRDSQIHFRVQQFIAESLDEKAIALGPDDLEQISSLMERHLASEKEMLRNVEELLGNIRGKKMLTQEYLLNFLVEDEMKHFRMLTALDGFKKGVYPYA